MLARPRIQAPRAGLALQNINEWVDPDGNGTLLSYDGNVAPPEWNSIYDLNGSNPNNSAYLTLNVLNGAANFLPKHLASYVGFLDAYGLGIIRKSDSAGATLKGLFRGGYYGESVTSENRIGIFSAWIGYAATFTWSNLGFRCAFDP